MRAFVRFRMSGGDAGEPEVSGEASRVVELGPGDLIGRTWTAALCLQDPAVSEAHAMVSLRGSSLKLLALRGRFAVDDKSLSDVELTPGLTIMLTREVRLDVVEVVLPDAVLGLEGDGLARQILGGVSSLRVRPRPELVPGAIADADATFWSDGLGWMVRLAESHTPRPFVAGDALTLHGQAFRGVAVAIGAAGQAVTAAVGTLDAPLHIVVRYDTAHIHRVQEPSLALDGISARILSELASIRLPVAWEALAREVWPDEDDLVALRRRWDTALARLRKKLKEHRIRPDLVRADGTGNFEIFLQRGDRIDDQT